MLKRDYGEDATRTTRATGEIDNVRHVARVWAARILDRMGRPARHARLDQDVLIELGLIEHKDPMQDVHDVLDDRDRVRARRRELEAIEWAPNGHLARNLGFVTSRFGLAEADCAVLAFLAICFRFEWLRELVEDAAECSCLGSPAECAAAATGISTQAAWHALRREGVSAGAVFWSTGIGHRPTLPICRDWKTISGLACGSRISAKASWNSAACVARSMSATPGWRPANYPKDSDASSNSSGRCWMVGPPPGRF